MAAQSTPYPVDHSFDAGLLADLPDTGVPATVVTDGRNMHLLGHGAQGNQLILQNDQGNRYLAGMPPGWAIMNPKQATFNGVAYFVLAQLDAEGNATGRGQLGSFPSPEPNASGNPLDPSPAEGQLLARYRPLHNYQSHLFDTPSDPTLRPFESDAFNFSLEHPVEVEVQADYDGTVNLILNDNFNPPRIINTRFSALPGGRYKIVDRAGNRDTNLYNVGSFGDTALLFQRSRSIVKASFERLLDGGQVAGGTWTYYIAYVNQDGEATDVVAWTPPVPVFDGTSQQEVVGTSLLTTRRVQLRITGLDRAYEYLRVFAVHTGGLGSSPAINAYQLLPDYRLLDTNGGELQVTHTGYEQKLPYDRQLLNLRTSDIETFACMTQVDNLLAFAGPKQAVYDDALLRNFAQQTQLRAAAKQLGSVGVYDDGQTMGTGTNAVNRTLPFDDAEYDGRVGGYLNPWNCTYRLGYPSGESLPFGIVFVLNSGAFSAVFPVRGHDHLMSEQVYTNDDADLDDRGWATSGENTDGIFRFPQISRLNAPITGSTIAINGISYQLPVIPEEIRAITVGAFFVRAPRNPDRLCQGYAVPVLNSLIQGPGSRGFDHQDGAFDGMFAQANQARRDGNLKVLPAVAGVLETAVKKWEQTDAQGRIRGAFPFEFPYKLYGTRNILSNWRVAFYSPDTAANPTAYQTLLARPLRMSQQAEVQGRAVAFDWSNYGGNSGSFAVWKTTYQTPRAVLGQPKMTGYWTEAAQSGANTGGFGSLETRLVGKHINDDRYLVHCSWDAYLGLVGDTYFDGELQRISNSSLNFGGVGTGREIASYVRTATATAQQRPIAWLVNLYPQHSSDDNIAAVTQGARPRDVLRDVYPIDSQAYFPISPVLTWAEVETALDADRRYVCFGGDTYKTMSYRRLTSNVREDQTWLDPNFSESPICTVLSMVAESESNPHAGRIPETSTHPGEGSPRSFWMNDLKNAAGNVNIVRGNTFKEPETTGYNAGFSRSSGFQQLLSLPRNVPFLAKTFPNDIAVTAPHVAGGFQNGYRRYRPGSTQTYNREMGSITGLVAIGRVLVAGLERGIISVAVNERTESGADTTGSVYLEVKQILSPYSVTASREIGLLNWAALVASDDYAYGVDYAGVWRLQPGAKQPELLSALHIEKLLIPRLRLLGTHRGNHLLTRLVSISQDRERGDVLITVLQNAYAPLEVAYTGPADPYELPAYVSQPVQPVPPFETPDPHVGPWKWTDTTCLQLVYSARLEKWMVPASYRAQHILTLQRRLYSIPVPGLGSGVRPGLFVHDGNPGYYYDQVHESYVDVVVRGSGADVQHILDNLMVVSNGVYPHHFDFQPEDQPVTQLLVVPPAAGNIAQRNAHYREHELWVTVPHGLHGIRQRAKTIRVRIAFRTRKQVFLTMLRAWLKDSFA